MRQTVTPKFKEFPGLQLDHMKASTPAALFLCSSQETLVPLETPQ